jgi:hypothetical protein
MTKILMIKIRIMTILIMYCQVMIQIRGVGRADSLRGGEGVGGIFKIYYFKKVFGGESPYFCVG